MITIIHGDNVVAGRNELEKIRTNFSGEIVVLEGKNLSPTDLIQATQSQSLLSEKRLVIVENCLEFEIGKNECDMVFWYDKEIGKTILDKFKKYETKILLFKTDTLIFKFCDNILPGNGKKSVELFRSCLQSGDAEYIFIMIVRQFRLMLNPLSLTPWQQSKVVSQAKAFGQNKLESIYKKLLEMDYQNKTGQLPMGLAFSLEVFLLNL